MSMLLDHICGAAYSYIMTDSEVIDFLGGTCKLAKLIKVDPRVVSNWRMRGRGISGIGRYKIRDLARRKRIKLPEDFMQRGKP